MSRETLVSMIPLIILITIVLIMCSFAINATIINEYKIKNKIKLVKKEALNGNKYAVEMMRYKSFFRDEDMDVIKEALNGNKNALYIMGYTLIEEKE